MPVTAGPIYPGVKKGLVFAIDPANKDSWAGPTSATVDSLTLYSPNSSTIYNDTSGSYGDNESFDFDGIDDYISSSPSLSGLTDISIGCWAKFDNINNNDFQYVLLARNSGTTNSYRLGIAMIKANYFDASSRNALYTINGSDLNISSFIVSQNVWYNITVTHSGTSRKLYVNGNLISTFTLPVLNLGNTLEIGRFQNDNHYLPGQVGPTLIYNRALSAGEILQNYNRLKGRFGLS